MFLVDLAEGKSDQGQNLPPFLLDFFARFLPLWDGSGRRDAMFEILSYSPLLDFKGQFKPLQTTSPR